MIKNLNFTGRGKNSCNSYLGWTGVEYLRSTTVAVKIPRSYKKNRKRWLKKEKEISLNYYIPNFKGIVI